MKILPEPPYPASCCVEGCPQPGDYKAPKSRYQTSEYQYFCLEHIREFNRAWDYFDGWSREQIEHFTYEAALGHRPTWKIGMMPVFTSDALHDRFFQMLGETPPSSTHRREPRLPREQREALAVLGLDPGADRALIKTQYKKLVKKHHPDVNKGDKASEEALKRITAAYNILLKAESFS